MRRCTILSLAAIILLLGRARADDWPQWRGPTRNGLVFRSPALTSVFTDASLVWRSERLESGERGGRGSVVVARENVVGLTRTTSDGRATDHVFCLDATTGKTRWKTPLPGVGGKEPSSSTPCIDGDRIWVASSSDRVHCLDLSSGREIWSRQLERKSAKGIASSILKEGDAVFLLAGSLTALAAGSGEPLWRRDDIEGHQSSPSLYVFPDGRATIVCNTRLETWCVDATDGRTLWKVPGGGVSTPVIAHEYGGDFLVVLSRSRKNGLTAYRLRDREAPRKLWTQRIFDRGSSPVVHNGHVYVVAGGSAGHNARALCVHLDSGTVAWDENIGFAEISSPVVVGDRVIAICGTLVRLMAATPERFMDFGTTDCRVALCTSPAISKGRVFLRQANRVACYDLRAVSR